MRYLSLLKFGFILIWSASASATLCVDAIPENSKEHYINVKELVLSMSNSERRQLESSLGYEFSLFNGSREMSRTLDLLGDIYVIEHFKGTEAERAKAPVIVANHGFTHSSDTFNPTLNFESDEVKNWLEQGYRVILPDLPGRGRSLHASLNTISKTRRRPKDEDWVRIYNERYQSEILFLALTKKFNLNKDSWKTIRIAGHSQGAVVTLTVANMAKNWLKESQHEQPVVLMTPYLVYLSDIYEEEFIDRLGGVFDSLTLMQQNIDAMLKVIQSGTKFQLKWFGFPWRAMRRAIGIQPERDRITRAEEAVTRSTETARKVAAMMFNVSKSSVTAIPAVRISLGQVFKEAVDVTEANFLRRLLSQIISKHKHPEVSDEVASAHAELSLQGIRDFNGFQAVRELIESNVGVRILAGDSDYGLAPFFIMLALEDYLRKEMTATSTTESMENLSIELIPTDHYITDHPELVIPAILGDDLPRGNPSRAVLGRILVSLDPTQLSPNQQAVEPLSNEMLNEIARRMDRGAQNASTEVIEILTRMNTWAR